MARSALDHLADIGPVCRVSRGRDPCRLSEVCCVLMTGMALLGTRFQGWSSHHLPHEPARIPPTLPPKRPPPKATVGSPSFPGRRGGPCSLSRLTPASQLRSIIIISSSNSANPPCIFSQRDNDLDINVRLVITSPWQREHPSACHLHSFILRANCRPHRPSNCRNALRTSSRPRRASSPRQHWHPSSRHQRTQSCG